MAPIDKQKCTGWNRMPIVAQNRMCSHKIVWSQNKYSTVILYIFNKYRLNTENGGFTPDESRGPKAPRDLSGVKPTFEVFNRLKTRSRRFC